MAKKISNFQTLAHGSDILNEHHGNWEHKAKELNRLGTFLALDLRTWVSCFEFGTKALASLSTFDL